MGLVYDGGKYVTLTDILGAEDAFGDMDFKVAGTADAVTALQLDTKIDGLPADVLAQALHQAKEARLKILAVMHGAIAEPRTEVADSAPKIVSMEIPIDKIGEVIGPKGKVINTLQQETGADIAVDDDGMVGTVTIGAKDGNAVEEARRRIALILDPPTADVGCGLPGQGGQPHQVRRLRQHAARPRRPAAHLQALAAGRRQAGRTRSRTSSPWARRSRCGWTTSTRRARCRCRWPTRPRATAAPAGGPDRGAAATAASGGDRGDRGDRGERRPRATGRDRGDRATGRPATPPAARRRSPSRTPSRPSWWPTWATSDPARRRAMPATERGDGGGDDRRRSACRPRRR